MKVAQQVEQLLRQGKKPKELLDLGFSNRAITSARRQLKKEKSEGKPIVSKNTAVQGGDQLRAASVEDMKPAQQRLAAIENCLAELKGRIELLEAAIAESVSLEDIEARLDGTPALGLKDRFKCECGASGFVALHIQCTSCEREIWWGWFPK